MGANRNDDLLGIVNAENRRRGYGEYYASAVTQDKAFVNASAATSVSLVTLGTKELKDDSVLAVTAEDRANGYGAFYMGFRIGTEVAAQVGLMVLTMGGSSEYAGLRLAALRARGYMALQGAAIAGKGAATFGIAAGNMWQEGVNAEKRQGDGGRRAGDWVGPIGHGVGKPGVVKGVQAFGREGAAAAIGGIEESSGSFQGKVEELTQALRSRGEALNAGGRAQLNRIADRVDMLNEVGNVHLLKGADFEARMLELGQNPRTTRALYKNGEIFLNRSRGSGLLEDLAHEGTHAVDFAPRGRFAGIDPGQMTPEQVFTREYRAFMAEHLVTGEIPQGSRQGLIDFILREYSANLP